MANRWISKRNTWKPLINSKYLSKRESKKLNRRTSCPNMSWPARKQFQLNLTTMKPSTCQTVTFSSFISTISKTTEMLTRLCRALIFQIKSVKKMSFNKRLVLRWNITTMRRSKTSFPKITPCSRGPALLPNSVRETIQMTSRIIGY